MKNEKVVAEEAVAKDVTAESQSEDTPTAAQSDAVEPAAQADAASNAAPKKATAADVARSLITPERILGLISLLLIPCFFTAWVHLPVTEKIGVEVELSMPEALSAGSSAVTALQNVSDMMGEIENIVNEAVNVIDKVVDVIAIASTALNSDSDDYKAALTNAVGALIDDAVDESKAASTAVKSKANEVAEEAVDKTVDKAAEALEGEEAQQALDKATEAVEAAGDTADDVQSAAKDAQETVSEVKAQYDSGLQTVKTILGIAQFIWFAFLLLLLVAGILLIVGVKGRYVTGIVAFALSAVASLAAIIGVSVANQAILDAVTGAVGVWVLGFVSNILAVTAWPWVVCIVSIAGLVALSVRLHKHRMQLKAAEPEFGQTPLKPEYVESASQTEAAAE